MPESHLRAADADRAAVAEVLGTHMSAGRLTVAEFDDRLSRAYAARTYGELDELTADLPAVEQHPAVRPDPSPVVQPACGGPVWGMHSWMGGWGNWGSTANGLRAAWASWLTTAVLVIGIWALTSVGSGEWIYPWPVWVIGPWGVVLVAQTLGGTRGPGRDRQGDRQRDRRPGQLHG
jgi:hypothetical protein